MGSKITPDWDIRDAIVDAGALDAYKCYQCGKCMAVCPWCHVNAVTFPVYRVPQAVKLGAIMASEDTAEIEKEVTEVYRCVGCDCCTSRCPHGVSLPDIMRGIRRVLVEFGSYPAELKDSISRIQSDGNPFGEARERRCQWIEELKAPAFGADKEFLWFPCCVPAYDPRVSLAGRASLAVLRAADVSFGFLGNGQACCCESVRKVGAEDVFQDGANANITAFKDAGVRKILASSPHCCIAFEKDYPELGADFEVVHQTQLFHQLIEEGKLSPRNPLNKRVVYHDPCTLGRQRGVYEEPREVLRSIPELELVEIPDFAREHSVCCGGGGGGAWLERPKEERLSDVRVRQAAEAGAEILAVACPHCLQMFEDSVKRMDLDLLVKDVSELLAEALEPPPDPAAQLPTTTVGASTPKQHP